VDAVNKPDSVFPHFIVAQLPVGLTGLVIASIFAAAQSPVSSSVNSSATLILCDVYRRYLRPTATERESMRVLHVATIAVGLAGTGMALAMMQIKSALDAWWSLASIFSGGMLGLFLLGLLARRAGNVAAACGVVTGVILIAWMTFSPKWTGTLSVYRSPFHTLLIVVASTLTILGVGLLLSFLKRPIRAPSVS
jgi:SSS family solute:Na+ symporter